MDSRILHYYKRVDSRGEDDVSDESAGRFVGFSERLGIP